MARLRFTLTRQVVQINSLDLWTNRDDGGDPWTTGAAPTINFNTNGQESDLLVGAIADAVSGENEFNIELNIAETGGANVVDVELILLDASFNELDSDTTAYATAGDKTINVTLDAGGLVPSYLAIKSQVGATLSPPFTRDVTINSVEIVDSVDLPESLEISEPDGWKGSKIILERDKELFSLIEHYEGAAGGAFIFYGNNGTVNGGIDFIKQVEQSYGFNKRLNIDAEYTPDNLTYEDLFTGKLNIAGKNEMKDNRMQVPVVREDFWTKFVSRFNTSVDFSSTTDLDGNAVDAPTPITVALSPQLIRYNGEYNWKDTITYPENGNATMGLQMDWDKEVINDFGDKKFSLPRVVTGVDTTPSLLIVPDSIVGIVEAPWDGTYNFDIRVEMARYSSSSTLWEPTSGQGTMWIQKAGEPNGRRSFTETNITYGSDEITVFTYSGYFFLTKGEQISIYGLQDGNNGRDVTIFGSRILNWLTDCRVATTGNITLSGTQTIDGVSLIAGDRVLVKDQSSTVQNGVYVVDAGVWSRSTDADTSSELQDAAMGITVGSVNGGTFWAQNTGTVVVGTTGITFASREADDTRFKAYPGSVEPDTHLTITADTTYAATEAQGYLLHDAFDAVIKRICGNGYSVYSELLGSTVTNARQYDQDGCWWRLLVIKGLQLRGKTLSQKPFFTSFKQLLDGANPIINLGVGYDVVNSNTVFRIEGKAHFLVDDPIVNFSNVRDISSEYDSNFIFKKINVGYKEWQSEDVSGIDDPQTKHEYATILTTGVDISIESDFIAAGIAIEKARRVALENDKDYKHDNKTFVIALSYDDVSPTSYSPELDENFTSVINLNNSDSRYNLILTPARNLLRWGNYLGGCLQSYMSSVYKFVSGEGNYDMISDYDCGDDCRAISCGSVSEKANITVSNVPEYLFLPLKYTINIPLSWSEFKAIRNNPENAIGVSQSESGHISFFIDKLEYDLVKGQATLTAWPKTYFNIQVIDIEKEMAGCAAEVSGGGGIDTCFRITEDEFIRITEDGNNRVPEDCDA